jgi:hypothetical protein
MAARITFSITNTPASDIPRVVRSFAAKVDIDALKPGADVTLGNVRVQVAVPQESPIRAFARANGFEVGSRGRYSKTLIEAFEANQKAQRAAKREAAKARKAEREAVTA